MDRNGSVGIGDDGPELTSRHFLAWALEWKIELRHVQPRKSTQNTHVESFYGRLREEYRRVSWVYEPVRRS
jgi:putative transposase